MILPRGESATFTAAAAAAAGGVVGADGVAVTSFVSVPTTNHTLPVPWPLVSPDAASPEYSYSGHLPATSCIEPSLRVIVLNIVASSPELTAKCASTTTGGHVEAHAPLQVLAAALSFLKPYSVLPFAPTRILPNAVSALLTATAGAAGTVAAGTT